MADRIKGITVEIGGDTTGLSKALSGVNKEISGTQKQLKDVERLLKLDPGNTELLRQKQELLTKAVEETKGKLDTLKEAEKQVQQQFERGEVSKEQYDALRREIVETEQSLQALEEQAENSYVSLTKIGIAGDKVSAFGDKVSGAGKKLLPLTGAIAGVGAASVAAFNEMNDGYDIVITKTGATGEALENLKKSTDEVFKSLPIDADTAGIAIGEVNTRFGATGEELEDLSKKFIQFADINGTDLNSAIDSVDAIMTKFGVDSSQTGEVLGLLTKAGQDTGLSMDTLQNSLQTNGATLKEMGLDLTSSVNLLAQFESSGVDATAALAGLKKAQQNATAEGKTLEQALGTTIEKIKNAGNETEALQIATDLFGKKGAAEMTQAIREGRLSVDDLAGSLKDYGNVVEDTFTETLHPSDKAKVALNNLKVAGSELGTALMSSLAPIIDRIVDKVKEFTDWFGSLSDGQKKTILTIGGVVAAAGPLLMIIGKAIGAVGGVMKAVSKIGPAISAIKGVISGLFSMIMAHPVIAIIMAIVAAVVTLYNKCEWFRDAVNAVWGAIKEAFSAVWDWIVAFFTETIPNAWNSVVDFFNGIPEWWSNLWDGIFNKLSDVWSSVQDIFAGITDFIQNIFMTDWSESLGGLGDLLNGFFETVKDIWDGIKRIFQGIVDFVAGIFTGDWERAWGGVKDIFGGIFDTLVAIAKAPLNGIIALVNGVISGVNWLIDRINSISIDNPFTGEKLVGFNLSHVGKIPYLAKGGILSQGSAVVGEAGPELLTMSGNRAIVQPLTNQTTTNHNLGGVTVYVYGAPGQDVNELAEIVADRIDAAVARKGAAWGTP